MAAGNVLTDAGKRHAPAQDGDVNTLLGKLVVNQGAADDEIVALKSADVAHGVTTVAETDTYGQLKKRNAASGGLLVQGINEDPSVNIEGVMVQGIQAVNSVVKSSAALAAVVLDGKKISGTGVAVLDANANVLAVSNNDSVRFILDADGDSHQDVGTAWTNFDIFDDVEVLNALAAYVTRRDDPVRGNFRQWLEDPAHRLVLEKYRLVTFNEDGHHFVNMSRLTMLLVGAVRQMGAALHAMALGMEQLGRRMRALEAGG